MLFLNSLFDWLLER